MATIRPVSIWTIRLTFLQGLALLALALIPLPPAWTRLRAAVDSAKSPELNRAEREVHAAGYYEGLIGGGDAPEGARGELALLLMGKPSGWVRFSDANVSRVLRGDFLQFELLPDIRRILFGQPFATNSHGMHSPEVALEKPPGTFRIAVLGASMDMGWGVTFQETYSHRLERWLNNHNRLHNLAPGRQFEVLNFAVAAYSPLQRLESLRRKAMAFKPDLVIYSATMLDLRLMEIHLCDALRTRSDLTYDFVRQTLDEAGVTPDELAVEGDRLIYKDAIKAKVQPRYWDLYDRTLERLAAECRGAGVPLLVVIVPRVGKADAPSARAEPVARLKALAAHHALPAYDLTASFDRYDPASLEIAAWDDHPNALGHRRLFLALARSLAGDPDRYRLLFPAAGQRPAGGAATDDVVNE
ncbi:SGNH/GDSL hydrolase family protein [Aquisphaera insulae]|uniref:SGNH/GDSL hydrolase family protein n=1 Tax=Aquisphaera insulae TaxID=2712864 RepID=UPI0013ED82C5|nr:SGNH/GDSL hydrolase family protein [Aquisphaera insulae]